ncbi:MAG TPA: type II toxin-antitoxin system PemK/MazF family toxin [Trichormus sp.]|jgi:mRNA interferase MazF
MAKEHYRLPRRGDVWRVNFPNRPKDPHLPRPAVVISNDNLNEFADAVLVIPITDEALLKRKSALPTHVILHRGVGGLTKDSRAMCEQIVSVEKSRLIEPVLGTIPSTLMTALVVALRKAVE